MKHVVVLLHVNEHRDTLVILQPEPGFDFLCLLVIVFRVSGSKLNLHACYVGLSIA